MLWTHRAAVWGRVDRGVWVPHTWMCCCSLLFSLCSCRLHSSSSPTRASSSDTTSSSSCFRAASLVRVSSASEHSSASARSCSARRVRSSSSYGCQVLVRGPFSGCLHIPTSYLPPPSLDAARPCPLSPGFVPSSTQLCHSSTQRPTLTIQPLTLLFALKPYHKA